MRISGNLIFRFPTIIDGLKQNFEDSNRLNGGNRRNGGLANVNYNRADYRDDNIAGCPLVVSKVKSTPFSSVFYALNLISANRPAFFRFLIFFLPVACMF